MDLKESILKEIHKKGGWVNTHSHLDRAFTLSKKNFPYANAHLHQKWELVDELKRTSTVSNIYDRMAYGVEKMLAQGVQALGSFIDVDEVIKDKSIIAAQKIRDKYKKDIKIKYMNQVLKGVINKEARRWFDLGASFVDIVSGLPGRDKGHEEEHLDIVFDTAKKMGKMIHVHVDQLNTSKEKETDLLAKKTKEHKMEGKVVGIHGISIAAHPKEYRKKLYKQIKDAGLMLISCPTAWIDSIYVHSKDPNRIGVERSEEMAPIHNAILPVDELLAEGITVGIGTDNINDIYKPFTDGDMWTELRFMLESCRYYDVKELVKIATINGLKVLGLT
ncbi:MAG: amidohydrolase family protein [Candidatus Roizmanbacteria bacterium]|nr:MAG: amidohydrolase family protein [Candidatus Roizmanbacteria bacterium]